MSRGVSIAQAKRLAQKAASASAITCSRVDDDGWLHTTVEVDVREAHLKADREQDVRVILYESGSLGEGGTIRPIATESSRLEQRRIRAQLDIARAAFQERLSELKEQHASERAKWHDRSCRLCGTTFRYHEDWKKVPDLCPSCREREKAKWQEKPCKSCGSPVRYRVDWTRIPKLCKQCQERERAKWSERPCKGCGRPIRYNIEWAHPPNYCKSCKEGFTATAGKSGTPRHTG